MLCVVCALVVCCVLCFFFVVLCVLCVFGCVLCVVCVFGCVLCVVCVVCCVCFWLCVLCCFFPLFSLHSSSPPSSSFLLFVFSFLLLVGTFSFLFFLPANTAHHGPWGSRGLAPWYETGGIPNHSIEQKQKHKEVRQDTNVHLTNVEE